MTDELKPCPFCGGEAACIEDGSHSTAWEIGCYNGQCAAEPSVWEPRKEMAIAAWNTRAAPPLNDPLVLALVEAANGVVNEYYNQVHGPVIYNIKHLDAALEAIASPSISALEENK